MSHCSRSLLVAALAIVTLGGCPAPVERQFSYSTDAPSRTGLTLTPSGVLVGNEAGNLFLLAPSGARVWKAALGREIAARPVAEKGFAVAATVAGELVGLALADGTERWRVTDLPPVVTPLATDGERAFVIGTDGSARAFDLTSGALVWARATLSAPKDGATARPPAPRVAANLLLVASADAGLLALRPADGATLWKAALPGLTGLDADAELAYLGAPGGRIVAVSLKDGTERWSRTLPSPLTSGPFLVRDTLFAGEAPSALVGLSPKDGANRWRAELPAPLLGAPSNAGDLLLVPTAGRAGQLVAFRLGPTPVFTFALDSPLRTEPRVFGQTVMLLALDGRVIGLTLKER